MYYVKSFDFNQIYCEQTIFASAIQKDCWDFIRNHLTCQIPSIRQKAKKYVVMDSLDRCYDMPISLILLKRNVA